MNPKQKDYTHKNHQRVCIRKYARSSSNKSRHHTHMAARQPLSYGFHHADDGAHLVDARANVPLRINAYMKTYTQSTHTL